MRRRSVVAGSARAGAGRRADQGPACHRVLNEFLAARRDTPVVVDTGDALFAAVDIRANEILAPAYYATMGFAVPAALGAQIASGQRPIVIVGDGAFQMTGRRFAGAGYGCRPVVVVFNNTRWEMLQAFFPDAKYNATVAWPFAELAELWGGRGFNARTTETISRGARRRVGERRVRADRSHPRAWRHLTNTPRVCQGI